jgi:hypothetical protein
MLATVGTVLGKALGDTGSTGLLGVLALTVLLFPMEE